MTYTIYIIEDEPKIAQTIADFLKAYGYHTVRAENFEQILSEFHQLQPDLVILDINLPYQDGYHLCRQIRESSHVPILFLSSRSGEMDQIFGIETGGDDYLTKPFQLDLLLAKIKALLRRAYGDYRMEEPKEKIQRVGPLQLNMSRLELMYQGEKQSLTKNEGKLLSLLMKQAGQVITREECLEVLWDDIRFVDDNTLTVNVTRVRKKLAKWNLDSFIETKRGVGYRLNPERLESSHE